MGHHLRLPVADRLDVAAKLVLDQPRSGIADAAFVEDIST